MPAALAEETCDAEGASAGDAYAYAERGCEGSVFLGASVTAGQLGRAQAQWERDAEAGYTSLVVAAPPRYASWHEDAHGCALDVGVAGHERLPCPTSPPAPPWLLP